MSGPFAIGLVVGKFSPLHRGHQHLIDRASAQCERLVVISWSKPEFERCDAESRERWLAELYPTALRLVIEDAHLRARCAARGITAHPAPPNDADAECHRAFVAWLCLDVLEIVVDAVFTSEDYGDGFAASLEQHFTRRLGTRRAVRHVSVDRDRVAVPVSGSSIRADVRAHRAWLAPAVWADVAPRVAILGGESSGKTTLAQALAARLGTAWVPEYGRELWEQRRGQLAFADMLDIAREQIDRERLLAREASGWLCCDTTPLTTLFYSQAMFERADPQLETLASRRYGVTVLCAPDFAFVQDGTRRDVDFRARQHAWYLDQLGRSNTPHILAAGSTNDRVTAVVEHIERLAMR